MAGPRQVSNWSGVCGAVALVLIVPSSVHAAAVSQQKDNNIMKHESDCWAEIYMNEEFDKNEPRLLLVGPHELPTLKGLNDLNWDNDIESVIMGPAAVMTMYEAVDFKGRELRLTENQRAGQLRDVHMSNEIESLRLGCR